MKKTIALFITSSVVLAISSCNPTSSIDGFKKFNPPLNAYEAGINQEFDEIKWDDVISVSKGSLHLTNKDRVNKYYASFEQEFLDILRNTGDGIEHNSEEKREGSKKRFYSFSFNLQSTYGRHYAFVYWWVPSLQDGIFLPSIYVQDNDEWKCIISIDHLPPDIYTISEGDWLTGLTPKSLPNRKSFFEKKIREIVDSVAGVDFDEFHAEKRIVH